MFLFFRKLKKVWTMLQSAKSELADLQVEQQREMEGLLEVRIIFSGLSLFRSNHILIFDLGSSPCNCFTIIFLHLKTFS